MSSNTPYDPSGGPEYLGDGEPGAPSAARGGRGKKTAVLGVAALAVAAVIGAGGWAALQLMSGGSPAASAVPANAIGYVSLDLDPSAGQKIEAIKTLKKFPGLDKELDLGSRDDLRRWVFTKMQEDGTCKNLDYARDIEPWIGDRIALAAVPNAADSVDPLVAVQVSDHDAAVKGVKALVDCGDTPHKGGGTETGTAFVGDYLLVSDSQKHADAMAAAAEQSALQDDPDFQSWMGKAGDPGVMTMYAAPDAVKYLSDLQEEEFGGSGGELGGGPDADQMKQFTKDFKGMAGVIRFEGGALEAEFVGNATTAGMTAQAGAGSEAAALPATTGAALALSFPDHWLQNSLDSMAGLMGPGMSTDELLAEGEAATGLKLPEDVETLLGDGVSVAVDSSTDFKALSEAPDPSGVPAGVRIKGDPDKIDAVLDKIKKAIGPDADQLVVENGDGVVALGLNRDYVQKLTATGTLGADPSFENVVPEASRSSLVFYVNFDAGQGWAERLADLASDGDQDVVKNVAPLDAFGFSAWEDSDKVQHALVRLTTD